MQNVMDVIELLDVERRALRGCDLLVGRRARVGILGATSSGKSTLLRVIYGAEEPDSGRVEMLPYVEVLLLPREIESDERTPLELSRSSRPDLQSLEDELSECARLVGGPADADFGREHLALERQSGLLRRFRELGGPRFEGESRRRLGEAGFTRTEMSRPLSGFDQNRRRLASLAALISRNPDLLVLDEPDRGLSAAQLERMMNVLNLFDGALVVASTDLGFLERTTDSVFELRDGRLSDHARTTDVRAGAEGNVVFLSSRKGDREGRGI